MIDDIIECRTGEITQYNVFIAEAGSKSVDGEKQRMVSITFKTISNGRDIYQIVWLNDDKTWYDLLSGDSAVKEVQLHPFA